MREASIEDAGRLALVGAATFLETFAGVLDGDSIVAHCTSEHGSSAYQRLLGGNAKAWIAEVDPEAAPVGYALVAPTDLAGAAADGTDMELKRLYVLSRFHGLGLGRELMGHAVAEAVSRGARRLVLAVYSGNARALAFYAKAGFHVIGERRGHIGGKHYDDVVLAKTVA